MAYICLKKPKQPCDSCPHNRYDDEHGDYCCFASIDLKDSVAVENGFIPSDDNMNRNEMIIEMLKWVSRHSE